MKLGPKLEVINIIHRSGWPIEIVYKNLENNKILYWKLPPDKSIPVIGDIEQFIEFDK